MITNRGEHAMSMVAHYLSPLQMHIEDPTIQEIMINRPDDIWIERRGVMTKLDVVLEPVQMIGAITVLAKMDNKDVKSGTLAGIVDTRHGDYRVAAVLAPTAIDGHAMCIRKHGHVTTTLKNYAEQVAENTSRKKIEDVVSEDVQCGGQPLIDWLEWVIRARKNIIVSGGTSSGKTTFLNALLANIPAHERVVTIEQVPELQVNVPNKVRLEANPKQENGVSIRELVILSLRFNPDRIIVGEVRSAEAFDFIQSMNTGHDGGAASLHANDAQAALSRLETLILTAGLDYPMEAIRNEIASSIDYVIHMSNFNGMRYVDQIMSVDGYDGRRYETSFLLGKPRKVVRD